MGFSRTTLDAAQDRMDALRTETRLYEVTVWRRDALGDESSVKVTVPALSVFVAAATAMSLLIQIGELATDDFLSRQARVVSVIER